MNWAPLARARCGCGMRPNVGSLIVLHLLVGCVVLLVPRIAAAAGFAASSFAGDWGAGSFGSFCAPAWRLHVERSGRQRALTVISRWRAFQLGDPRPKVINHRISPRLSSSTLIRLPRDRRER